MLFIEYPKCSTCVKAKKWLLSQNVTFTSRHIVEQNPTYEELKEWLIASNLPIKRLFNTSGLLYKELNLKDQLPNLSDEEALRLLASNGMLVKRPILVTSKGVTFGFDEQKFRELL